MNRDRDDNGQGPNGSIDQYKDLTVDVAGSRRGLLSHNDPLHQQQKKLSFFGNRRNLLKFGSPSAKFKLLAQEREKISRSVESPSVKNVFSGIFHKKIDWSSLWKMIKEWFHEPMNLALFLWILCVAVSGAILFLVLTGMLNHAIPSKSRRNTWFEVNNQILNALFTLMCLYQHPKRCYHLFLLIRWRPDDVTRLRKVYCKNGCYKPHEWAHMMVVVILLHINCFSQYALCGLNVGYRRSQRPAIGVGLCVSVAISAPAIAGLYCIVSPLGREYDTDVDEEAQVQHPNQVKLKSFERRYSFAMRTTSEIRPSWSGGILDIWDDISLAYLSLFCTCCVFGWNMERLGFGNMYVHIATFLLFCMAPFWIFSLAAVNMDNETIREALVLTGVVLCCFGLLYGGFWRVQMRKRFQLPAHTFCFKHPSASDCTLWFCCCWCSLAQEVRTGNSYEVVEDKLCRRGTTFNNQIPLSPLSFEDRSESRHSPYPKSASASPAPNLSSIQESSAENKDEAMLPPSPVLIDRIPKQEL